MPANSEEVIALMQQYARLSMEAQYWDILRNRARDTLRNPILVEEFGELWNQNYDEAIAILHRLQELLPEGEAMEALDILDDEMFDIADAQAQAAIRSGAADGLRSAMDAVNPAAVYNSNPVRELQDKIERAFNVTIDRGGSREPNPDGDGPKDGPGGPKGKLLKFGKRLLSALPIVGAGMALYEAGSSLGAFRDMQAFASELEDRGIASPAEIEELRRLANEFLAAAGGEFAAGLTPVPGLAEGGEIALNVIKEHLRNAYNELCERLENMEPVEDIEQSSFDAVAKELSDATGEDFSADDVEEMYGDSDSDLDELRERVDAYRERFRQNNDAIIQYRQMLDNLDGLIDQIDNIEAGQVMVSNDVPETPEEGFTPTRVAQTRSGNNGPAVT